MIKSQDELEEFAEKVRENKALDAPAGHSIVVPEETVSEDYGVATSAKMWAVTGRDYFPTESTTNKLKPGQYAVKHCHSRGIYFSERDINLDDLLVLPDSNSERVIDHIEYFWRRERTFREYGFLWKRGIMLWGPPGSGKTSTVQQLSNQIVELGGLTIYCVEPKLTSMGLDVLRQIEPERPIIVIFEDIDAIVQDYGEQDWQAEVHS